MALESKDICGLVLKAFAKIYVFLSDLLLDYLTIFFSYLLMLKYFEKVLIKSL